MAAGDAWATEADHRPRVLVVDDDPAVRELLQLYLGREGFEVSGAADGREALCRYREHRPDLILLDLMLPVMHGLEVCRAVRRTSCIPIIIVTALTEEMDRVGGLELGADDYITKPFSPSEVVARVKAILRRCVSAGGAQQVISLPGLRIDLPQHRVEAGGREVSLTRTEFRLLWCLASHPGHVFGQCELASQALASRRDVEAGRIPLHIQRLRRKLAAGGRGPLIATVRGLGYRLDAGVAPDQRDSAGGNSCQGPS
jgi:two-component system response regulator ResD